MKVGIALLRALVGALFMGHGLQKLAGWFGGHGLARTGQFFESLGLRPGRAQAAASGVAETAGGALLATGFLTPLGASLISGSMITAIRKVHAPKGVWISDGGYEYNLVLLGVVFAITDLGPGRPSLDAAAGRERWGPGWATAALAAGAIGSAAAVELGARHSSQETPREAGGAPAQAQEEVSAAAAEVNGGAPAPAPAS